jgi:hypothetical protein
MTAKPTGTMWDVEMLGVGLAPQRVKEHGWRLKSWRLKSWCLKSITTGGTGSCPVLIKIFAAHVVP